MPPADNTPDFDSMSPDEIMAWMESLAKRQGANVEELTTSADVEIPEYDPDTTIIDEPGYVPYGEERPEKPPAKEAPPPRQPASMPPPREPAAPPAAPSWQRPAASAPAQPPAPPPAPPRITPAAPMAAPPAQPPRMSPPAPPAVPPAQPPRVMPQAPAATTPSPASRQPELPPLPMFDTDELTADTRVTGSTEPDAMAWLESLAADQGDSLFNLDLSALSEELEHTAVTSPAAPVDTLDWLGDLSTGQGDSFADRFTSSSPDPADPLEWLDDLSTGQDDAFALPPAPPMPAAEPASEVSDPFASGVDPMAWLENLARRQGAKSEELTTDTAMNIPVPENAVIDEPGYKPFSFDSPIEPRRPAPTPEPLQLENPTSWLDSLAESQGFDERQIAGRDEPKKSTGELNVGDIERAISSGTVSPEQMQYYLEHQTDRYEEMLNEPSVDFDPDAPPVPAELPDWLLEQVGAPPAAPVAQPPVEAEQPALIDTIQEPPAVMDMPDWLREDIGTQGDLDFANIFANSQEEIAEPEALVFEMTSTPPGVNVDPNDPWVEAFDLEHDQGMADINSVPDWYARNLSDPQRLAAVDRAVSEAAGADLTDAALPAESELAQGEPESLPNWLGEMEAADPVSFVEDLEPAAVQDIPDWLREMESTVEPAAMPDWLTETFEDDPASLEALFEPEPPAPVAPPAPAPRPQQPAAPPPPPRVYAVSATIEEARASLNGGDLDASLAAYEGLIRANSELEAVVEDLAAVAKTHKNNPAVYRVLGDGLMRQGNLQAALDVYREALNQL